MLYGSDVAPAIGDYGIIGDCRSAALISRSGSLDWLCWPWFDSPSIFAAILDTERGGFWRIAPTDSHTINRRYVPGTNVLETEFHASNGTLRLTDCMPVYDEQYERTHQIPDREVLRRIECLNGEIKVRLVFAPRPKYGRCLSKWKHCGKLGVRTEFLGGALWLRGDLPLHVHGDHVESESVLRAGDRRYCSVVMMQHGPATLSPLGKVSDAALQQTLQWWKRWSERCEYSGPYREEVLRSALVLKLLEFTPSGAIVAAPTSSLPERIGGDLNWDYRYCWLRDASMTVAALFGLGYHDEAEAFIEWLLHSTHLTQPRLLVMYGVYGKPIHRERELDHLQGYRNSRPVRMGNDARRQIQMDVYGEVVSATAQLDEFNKVIDSSSARILRGIGKYVHKHWLQPDKGIWEPRGGPKFHTHSLLMCWTAMDKLLRLRESGLLKKLDVEMIKSTRDEIRRHIEEHGWNESLQTYTAIFDGQEVDASLLLLPKHEFVRADSPRMKSTYKRIQEKLGAGPGMLYRYRDPEMSPGEGAFGICSFWAAEYLALGGGTLEEADAEFGKVLHYSNDLGLFGEEIDPTDGKVLGNFPQAFTHVGLINTALTLAARAQQEERQVA
jgi:GH15 family glucan-1,4-alpha-glucosidase